MILLTTRKARAIPPILIKGAEIDAVVRPVFSFGDRNITINDANMKVSDHVLHYSFTINFRQAREQTNEFEPMESWKWLLEKECDLNEFRITEF